MTDARPLLGYQREYLADDAAWTSFTKARRAGGSFVVALADAAAAAGVTFDGKGEPQTYDPAKGVDQRITSASEGQAQDLLAECGAHLDRLARIVGETTLIESESASRIRLRNGRELRACAPSPRSIRGPGADLTIDESGCIPEPAALWQAAKPITDRTPAKPDGYRLRVCGTPLGDDESNILYSSARGRLAAKFSQHVVTMEDALRQGFPDVTHPMTPEEQTAYLSELREEAGSEVVYLEEYGCVFSSARDRLISEVRYDACAYDAAELPGHEHIKYAGYDVARSARGDNAALVEVQLYRDLVAWVTDIQEHRGETWDAQEKRVSAVTERCGRLAIDASSIGSMLSERLTNAFGSRVLPVDFASSTQREQVITGLVAAFEKRRVRVPRGAANLRRAVLSLRREITDHARVRYVVPRTRHGHGDSAIALALAIHAGGGVVGELRQHEEDLWKRPTRPTVARLFDLASAHRGVRSLRRWH